MKMLFLLNSHRDLVDAGIEMSVYPQRLNQSLIEIFKNPCY